MVVQAGDKAEVNAAGISKRHAESPAQHSLSCPGPGCLLEWGG
jgi:hypothetical protein